MSDDEDDDDLDDLCAEDFCDVCGEWGFICFCFCGAELCESCMEGHAHVPPEPSVN